MTESTPSWIRLLPIGLFLLFLAGAAGVALDVIHLRQEKGRLAASYVKLRSDVGETGRRLQEMTANVAAAQQPDKLRQRIGTRLVPMTEKQIVWVRPGSAPTPMATRPSALPTFASMDHVALPGMPR